MQRTFEAYKDEITMLKEKIKFFENVGPNKPTKEEKLDENNQIYYFVKIDGEWLIAALTDAEK